MDNKYWVQKADMTVQDFVTNGGFLNAEQTRELFEIQIQESVLMRLITTRPMSSNQFEISKLGFTGRVLRGAVENQGLVEADRSKPEAGQTVLTTQEFIAEARVPYSALEDHVTQGTLMTHVRTLLGKAIARDMEDLIINGDTASTDLLLKKLDGFIKQATSNVVVAGGVRLTKSVLKQMRQTMPSEYKRSMGRMAYMTSDNAAIDYGDSLASRATVLGDQKLMNATVLEYNGNPVVPIPLFPENLGGGSDETVALLADPKNAYLGIQRQVTLETDKDISARQWIVVATLKMDAKWAHEPAVVKATGILASAAP